MSLTSLNVNIDKLLIAKNIWKRFPGVIALKGVSIEVGKGEIVGIVGENGAGKSTLLKILYGIIHPDEGEIILEGRKITIPSPNHAIDLGIFYVPQEIILPPNLPVAEAMLLGCKIKGTMKLYRRSEAYDIAKKALESIGLENLDPSTYVKDLDTATRQLILVARAIALESKILMFDEPTSTLGPEEAKRLLNLLLKLKSQNRSILFVSHRIEEVISISDRIYVLRDGSKVAEFDNREKKTSIDEVIKAMIAREVREFYPKEQIEIGEEVLEVINLNSPKLKNISFKVRRGEILGFFGLLGSGITNLARVLAGYEPITDGIIKLHGHEIKIKTPKDAIKNGIIYIPEDRRMLGIFPLLTVKENMTISSLEILARLNLGLISIIDRISENTLSNKLITSLRIVPPDPNRKAMYMSGGNQQKLVVARAFTRPSKVIIFAEPTVGIDVGAKVEIRRLMVQVAKGGNSVLLMSSDLHEVIGMSDRIIVMSKGRIVGELRREEATPEKLLRMASTE